MSRPSSEAGPRVLIVDDDRGLHEDYDRCLATTGVDVDDLQRAREALFGGADAPAASPREERFRLVHAYAGMPALDLVQASLDDDDRYSVAFVDMRMPPGWNGIETIRRIWEVDAAMQVVLCTAFSDFTWTKVMRGVGRSEGLHLLRKPFAPAQVRRFAEVLSKKWTLSRVAALRQAGVLS
jgi:DNA-binding NtrC family response regulator